MRDVNLARGLRVMRGVNLARFSKDVFTITGIYDIKKYAAMSRVLDRAGSRAGSSEGEPGDV
jgi:hypothetical protein